MAACGFLLVPTGIAALILGSFGVAVSLELTGLLFIGGSVVLAKIRPSLHRLRHIESLLQATNSIVMSADATGTITCFNASAERALGYSAHEVIGTTTLERFHLRSEFEQGWGQLGPMFGRLTAENPSGERTYVRKDGTTFPAFATVNTILDESGEIAGYFSIGVDISERKAVEKALHEKQELIESIAATSPTIFYIFDLVERTIVYSNRLITAELGYAEDQIKGMGGDPLPCIMHPEDLDILFNRYLGCAQLRDGEVLEVEFRCLSANGELRWLSFRDVVFKRDAEGNPIQILVNVVDTTDRKFLDEQIESQVLEIQDTNLALEIQTNALEEANAQLEALAFTDGLTGIPNHRSFQEELARTFELAKRRKRRLSLMLIDVDRFKQYNDTYGHPSGDIVLKRVATVIRDSCPLGCMAARYGGEEFAVICPDFSANEVLMLAESIRNAVEMTPWPERSVTISIGAVSMSAEINTPSELVSASDNALYSSKASGRNCVTFYDFSSRRKLAS